MTEARVDCVAPDRTPQELTLFRQTLADNHRRLRRASEHFALLAGETRLKILALLEHAGELCVCDLATVLDMTPAAVSQHLSRLRQWLQHADPSLRGRRLPLQTAHQSRGQRLLDVRRGAFVVQAHRGRSAGTAARARG